jgi:ankyrin repeat protein
MRLEDLKIPLMKQYQGDDNKSQKSYGLSKKDAISSIHSAIDHQYGENHYLMDVPSPRFSSAMGDDFGDEDEKSEIIRCILHNDNKALSEILTHCSLDITLIRDEMGYSLIHLSAYNNSDKCMEILIHHLVKSSDLSQSNSD